VEKSYGPWKQKETGEEILQRDPPSKRYGIGVLYPTQTRDQDESGLDASVTQVSTEAEDSVATSNDDLLTTEARKDLEQIQERVQQRKGPATPEDDTDDLDLSVAVGTPVARAPPAQIRTCRIAAYGSYLG
jgi:hypothetical protein